MGEGQLGLYQGREDRSAGQEEPLYVRGANYETITKALQKMKNSMIDQAEAMLNENKEREEALLREVCCLKNELKEMKNDMKDLKDIQKELFDAGTS